MQTKNPLQNQENSTQQAVQSRLLTTKEAAKYLNLSIYTIWKLANERKISFVNAGIGKQNERKLFLKEDLDSYILSNRIANVPEGLNFTKKQKSNSGRKPLNYNNNKEANHA